MAAAATANSPVFSTGHIADGPPERRPRSRVRRAVAARREAWLEAIAVGLLTAGAVVLLRKSANMPQLNEDGLQGFSANDVLAPTVTFVVLGSYGAVRPPTEPRRFEQVRAAATVIVFAINVITI